MRSSIFIMLAMLAQSCQVYQSNFDCPPKEGIPCRSVTEIEAMIVESQKGPDILIEREPEGPELIQKLRCANSAPKNLKKIWITERQTECGGKIEGHYVYFVGDDCD